MHSVIKLALAALLNPHLIREALCTVAAWPANYFKSEDRVSGELLACG
jgi:hypothetical protein